MPSRVEELIEGPSGPASIPAAAVAANGVSVYGVLRYVQASGVGAQADAAAQDGDATTSSLQSLVKGLHDVLWDTDGVAAFPAAAVAANAVSIAEVLRYLQESGVGAQGDAAAQDGDATTSSVQSLVKGVHDVLWDADGVAAFPASAAPANGVSMAEVLREVYDLGERVISSTGVALTGGDVDDVFTVAGGPILLSGLWVDITTVVTANAALIHFESDPTVGASSTQISEGTAAPDIASAAVGDVFHINGDSQDVMKKAANGTDLPMMENQNGGIYVPVGGIDMKLSTGNPTTGAATLWMRYKPLGRGVTVT